MLIVHSIPCRACGLRLDVSPTNLFGKYPSVTCSRCHKSTQLSALVNIFSIAVAFFAGYLVVTALRSSIAGAPSGEMGPFQLVIMFVLGMGTIFLTQIVVASTCYLIYSYIVRHD